MTLKSHAKFKEKLTCSFKHDIRNLVNFHPTIQKSENCFLSKVQRFELKKYRGVNFRDTEQWHKIWINLDLVVSKLTWGIGWTFIKAHKSLKICTLMGSFCPKSNNSARKFQRNFVSWHWKMMQNLKEKLTRGLKNNIRNLVNFHASSWESKNLPFDGFLLLKAYKVLDEKVQKNYLS